MDVAEIRDASRLNTAPPLVATILPPRENFSPQATGAIGLLVNRMAGPDDLIIGHATRTLPFSGRRFLPTPALAWPPFGSTARYSAAVARVVKREAPAIIEVHNRPNLALHLARANPHTATMLFLHNDPQAMRDSRTPAERALLLRHMAVVCVSAYLRHRFMEGLATGDAKVLPNAIDWTELPPALPRDQRENTILFAGRVTADKGADAFVAACADILQHLPGWRAAIIGADRFDPAAPVTPFERALYPRAAAAGIERLGWMTHPELLDEMSRAAIVAVPSRWPEPFGMAALEAMACGAALVCSSTGGLREVAGDAALYTDPDNLAGALLSLCENPEQRMALALAGTARARQFDAPAARARLQEVRCCVSEGRHPSRRSSS